MVFANGSRGEDRIATADTPSVLHEMESNESILEDAIDEEFNIKGAKSNEERATEIRRQVEYYFSDENLLRDAYLYGKMGGSKNSPVPVGIIHSFNKMRFFQPYSFVVEALRSSKKLDVVKHKGRECLVRKEPFSRRGHMLLEGGEPVQKVKREKPTGFEEYWTDPPITPEDYAEERDLYDPDENSFADRIEVAIQRYKAKRRFRNRPHDIWTKFMRYGGIQTGPKQFSGGLDQEYLEDKTAAEIARMTATDFVGNDKYELGPSHKWTVDFEGVAKGFLSDIVTEHIGISNQADVNECTNILRNFYNYLLHHDVCPEYSEDILAARRICDLADQQLLGCRKASSELPGDFSKACSALFGGRYSTLPATRPLWLSEGSEEVDTGITEKRARQIFAAGLAAYAEHNAFDMTKAAVRKTQFEQTVDRLEQAGFEITSITLPDEDVRELYAKQLRGTFTVLGKMHCKPWRAPTFKAFDVPTDLADEPRPEAYEFWVEEDVLDFCFVGMKFQGEVCTTSKGLVFIDRIESAFPSYHTLLENELMHVSNTMRKWKEPREITREEHLERERRGQSNEETVPSIEEIDEPIVPELPQSSSEKEKS